MSFIQDTEDYLIEQGFKVDKTLTSKNYNTGIVYVIPSDYTAGTEETQRFQVIVAAVNSQGNKLHALGSDVFTALGNHPDYICVPLSYSVEFDSVPIEREGQPTGDLFIITCSSRERL